MAQFSSNWRVPLLPGGILSPTSVLWLKCCGLSPLLKQIHSSTNPSSPLCSVMGSKSLVPLPCSLHEDLNAHLVHCAQEKAG